MQTCNDQKKNWENPVMTTFPLQLNIGPGGDYAAEAS